MSRMVAPRYILLVAFAACAPQNAKLTEGSYVAFLSDGTSLSLAKEKVDPADYATTFNVDCREFEDAQDEAALRLDEAIQICGANVWPPVHEEWANQAGFRVVTETMDPWRGQALITSEGDLQIAFHHRVPGGSDMRFVIAIDPDFGPTDCEQLEDGTGTRRIPLDGDWISNWSTELATIAALDQASPEFRPYAHMSDYLDTGRLFFLNAFSYQLNPADADGNFWDLPQTWISGSAQGKFVEEELAHRTTRYGEPSVYNLVEVNTTGTTLVGQVDPADLWYCDMEEGTDPATDACMTTLDDRVHTVADEVRQELDRMMSPDWSPQNRDVESVFSFAPIAHANTWRAPDGRPPGLDGWAEMHYNYIVFSRESLLEEGGSAEGAFGLTLDSASSSTRVYITGKFEIPKIKRDRWTTDNLAQDKLAEAGVELCRAASEEEAAPGANAGN